MSQASFDASIPVLTEVLKAEPLGDEVAGRSRPTPQLPHNWKPPPSTAGPKRNGR
jgi:hypothetical protein